MLCFPFNPEELNQSYPLMDKQTFFPDSQGFFAITPPAAFAHMLGDLVMSCEIISYGCNLMTN